MKPNHTLFLAKPPWKSHPSLARISTFCECLHPPHQPPRRSRGQRTADGILPTMGQDHNAPRAAPAGGQQDHRDPGHTAAPVLPVASRPAAVPSLRPTVPRSRKLPPQGRAEGWVPMRRAAGRPRGSCGSDPASGLGSEIFLSVQKPQQSVLPCCPQCHPQPWQLLPSCHLETEIQQEKKNLTRAVKAPVPGSGKPRRDPRQPNHVLQKRAVWGRQMRGRGSPTGEEF